MEDKLREVLDLVLLAYTKSSELPIDIQKELKSKLDSCATIIEKDLIK